MKISDYLVQIQNFSINEQAVNLVEEKYKAKLDSLLKKIVSADSQGIFFEDPVFRRKLSLHEILNADSDLHVNFSGSGLIPLFDTGENDFVVYDSVNKVFCAFNINDEIIFKRTPNLSELLDNESNKGMTHEI